jgi:hypothetical protein
MISSSENEEATADVILAAMNAPRSASAEKQETTTVA